MITVWRIREALSELFRAVLRNGTLNPTHSRSRTGSKEQPTRDAERLKRTARSGRAASRRESAEIESRIVQAEYVRSVFPTWMLIDPNDLPPTQLLVLACHGRP